MMKRSGAAILTLLSLTMFVSCNGGQGGDRVTDIKVGAVLSLTGQYGEYGAAIKRGMEIAVEQINREGGVRDNDFEIEFHDSGSMVTGAREALDTLIAAGAKIIIGPETTDLATSLIPIAARNKIYLISPSASSPALGEVNHQGYFFRICPSDDSEAVQLAVEITRAHRLPYVKRGYHRALVLVRKDNPYTEGMWRSFAGELNDRGVEYEILYFHPEELVEGGAEVQEILSRAEKYRRSDEDPGKMGVIVIFGFADDVQFLLRRFKEEFFNPRIDSEYLEEQMNLLVFTSSAVDTTEFFVEAADVAEGLVFPRMFDPELTDSPVVKKFVDAYKEKYDENPDLYAAYGYDAALLVAYTLRREGVSDFIKEPLNFRLFMNDVKFKGVTGGVDFQQGSGNVAKTPTLYKMKEFGEAVTVKDFDTERIEARQKLLQERLHGN